MIGTLAALASLPTLPAVGVLTEPMVTSSLGRLTVVVAAYVLTLGLSGAMVRFFVLPAGTHTTWPPKGTPEPEHGWPRFDPSVIIGKCENLVTVTLVLTGNVAGLALIFAAKSLVRSDAIKRDPGFYLGGTMVNLVWGLMVAFGARVVLG